MQVSARISEGLKNRLINKSLEQYNTSIDKIYEKFSDGCPEKKIRWDDFYTWINEEDYEKYKQWAIDFLIKELRIQRSVAEAEFKYFDMACGLRQPYLFVNKDSIQKTLSF